MFFFELFHSVFFIKSIIDNLSVTGNLKEFAENVFKSRNSRVIRELLDDIIFSNKWTPRNNNGQLQEHIFFDTFAFHIIFINIFLHYIRVPVYLDKFLHSGMQGIRPLLEIFKIVIIVNFIE